MNPTYQPVLLTAETVVGTYTRVDNADVGGDKVQVGWERCVNIWSGGQAQCNGTDLEQILADLMLQYACVLRKMVKTWNGHHIPLVDGATPT